MDYITWPGGDNLYKFFAIGGVALTVICYIFPQRWSEEALENQLEAVSQQRQALVRLQSATGQLSRLTDELDRLIESQKRLNNRLKEGPESIQSGEARQRLAELEQRRRELLELRLRITEKKTEADVAKAKADAQHEIADYYSDRAKELWDTAIIGYLLGLVLFMFGIGAWYIQVQQPKDKLIKSQVEVYSGTDEPSTKTAPTDESDNKDEPPGSS